MTVRDRLRTATTALAETSDTARLDAELLMAHAIGISRTDLLLRNMDSDAPAGFDALLARRLAHEPVAYILGRQEFYGLAFTVTPAVLIPRADSEVVVDVALAAAPSNARVLDLGTGSGALLLAVLANLAGATGVGIDRSAEALAVAAANAAALNLADRARMMPADWDAPGWNDAFSTPFDLVLANPPYVETGAELAGSVRDHEPPGALFAGERGLDAYHSLIPQLPDMLDPSGLAIIEIGADQADAVSAIAGECGFDAKLHRDLAGRPRALALTRGG